MTLRIVKPPGRKRREGGVSQERPSSPFLAFFASWRPSFCFRASTFSPL